MRSKRSEMVQPMRVAPPPIAPTRRPFDLLFPSAGISQSGAFGPAVCVGSGSFGGSEGVVLVFMIASIVDAYNAGDQIVCTD
jgi:hypothetical protein